MNGAGKTRQPKEGRKEGKKGGRKGGKEGEKEGGRKKRNWTIILTIDKNQLRCETLKLLGRGAGMEGRG